MNLNLKERSFFFACTLVEYVPTTHNYRQLSSRICMQIRCQNIETLTSEVPSDRETSIASERLQCDLLDGNDQLRYIYRELLCMYADLRLKAKFLHVKNLLDELAVLPEVIESDEDYYLPLHSYCVSDSTYGYKVFDDDDKHIGYCEQPGYPIFITGEEHPVCVDPELTFPKNVQHVTLPSFEDVLDRHLLTFEGRYITIEDSTVYEDSSFSECESISGDDVLSLSSSCDDEFCSSFDELESVSSTDTLSYFSCDEEFVPLQENCYQTLMCVESSSVRPLEDWLDRTSKNRVFGYDYALAAIPSDVKGGYAKHVNGSGCQYVLGSLVVRLNAYVSLCLSAIDSFNLLIRAQYLLNVIIRLEQY